MRRLLRIWLPVVLVTGVLAGTLLQAHEAGEVVVKRGTITHDLYVAGGSVDIAAQVQGDVAAAGRRVGIDQQVSGDVLAAGETVTVQAQVGDDVRAAGRTVRIAGSVAGHVVAAGETVSLAPSATVGDWVWLAGREIDVAGKVGGELRVAGQLVIVSGAVAGDAELMAEEIRIPASARIDGNLIYHSEQEPEIAAGAVIGGELMARPLPERVQDDRGAGLLLAVMLAVATTVYFLVFPQFSVAGAGRLGKTPLAALGTGAAFLIVTPFVILLLFVTLIGLLVALPLLAWYLLSLLGGVLTGMIYVGDAGLRLAGKGETVSTGARVLSIVLAVAVIVLLQLVPAIGGLVMLLLLLLGLGALQLQAWRRYAR